MRILLFDNSQMVKRNNRYYCFSMTGGFAKELVDMGHDVTMYGQHIEDPNSISSFDIQENGIKTAGLRRYKSKLFSYLLLYTHAIKYILSSDFVYFFYPTSYCYLPFICKFFRRKYGLYVRGDYNIDNKLSLTLYRNAHVVFTVAQYFTDIVNAASNKNNGHTIRPMISYTNRDVLCDRLYKRKDKYEILFLCRIDKDKGIDELLSAAKTLIEREIKNFHITVVGDGAYLQTVREHVSSMSLEDYVAIKGQVNDEKKKKEFFMSSDIYILPTYYREGFPRTLYEAMVFGTPIITTFVSGIPSLMKDRYNCYRIQERSVNSIIDALTFAMGNYDQMGIFAKQATETVLKVLDPNRPSHAQDINNSISVLKKR